MAMPPDQAQSDATFDPVWLTRDGGLGPFLGADAAVLRIGGDGEALLDANALGRALFASGRSEALTARIVELAARLAPSTGVRLERLSFGRDGGIGPLTAACRRLQAEGEAPSLVLAVKLPEAVRERLAAEAPPAVEAAASDTPVEIAPAEADAPDHADAAEALSQAAPAEPAAEVPAALPFAQPEVSEAPDQAEPSAAPEAAVAHGEVEAATDTSPSIAAEPEAGSDAEPGSDVVPPVASDQPAPEPVRPAVRRRFVWQADPDGRLLTLSKEVEQTLGEATASSLIGRSWAELDAAADGEARTLPPLAEGWRDLPLLLPLAGTAEAVKVTLSGFAMRDASGAEAGFRGFGIVHPAERVALARAIEPEAGAPLAGDTAPADADADVEPPPADSAAEDALPAPEDAEISATTEEAPAAASAEDGQPQNDTSAAEAALAASSHPGSAAVEPVAEEPAPAEGEPAQAEAAPVASALLDTSAAEVQPTDGERAEAAEEAVPTPDGDPSQADTTSAEDAPEASQPLDEPAAEASLVPGEADLGDEAPALADDGEREAEAAALAEAAPAPETIPESQAAEAPPDAAAPEAAPASDDVEAAAALADPAPPDETAPQGEAMPAEAEPAASPLAEAVADETQPTPDDADLTATVDEPRAAPADDASAEATEGVAVEAVEEDEPDAAPAAAAEQNATGEPANDAVAEGDASEIEAPEAEASTPEAAEPGIEAADTSVPQQDGPPQVAAEQEPEAPESAVSTTAPTLGEPGPQEPARPSLSRAERSAFREIARALGARIEGEGDADEVDASPLPALPPATPLTVLPSAPPSAAEPGPRAPQPSAEVVRLRPPEGRPVLVPPAPAEPPRQPPPAEEAPAEPSPAEPLPLADLPELVDKLPVGIVVTQGETPVFANRTLLDLLGYPDLEALTEVGMAGLFAKPGPVDDGNGVVQLLRADGESEAVDWRRSAIQWQGEPATLMAFRRPPEGAETARANSLELDLEKERRHVAELAAVLDTATDGVVTIDDLGRILSLNRSAEALFGYDQREVTGEHFSMLLAPESHVTALDYLDGLKGSGVASLLNDGREVQGRVRQGGRIALFMTMGRIADGAEKRYCAVLRDMTSWKQAEADLLEARRTAEAASAQKSDVLAKISHEIRTPLNAILGFAELMTEERFGPIGNERYRDYLKDIHASGGYVISLVNDLLDLAKIEAGKMDFNFTAVSLNDIAAAAVSLLQPEAARQRVVLRTGLQPKLPPVVADERSLRQIVLNILSNAVKFTDPGGQVIVSTALGDRGEAILRVRDTGIGMTEKELAAALEPFRQVSVTRRGQGTGLGLPITRALVEANKGLLTMTSVKSEGTLVEVSFPPQRVLAS